MWGVWEHQRVIWEHINIDDLAISNTTWRDWRQLLASDRAKQKPQDTACGFGAYYGWKT